MSHPSGVDLRHIIIARKPASIKAFDASPEFPADRQIGNPGLADPSQKREVFHLAFLRALGRSAPLSTFVVKGGANLRFFFGSIRYSEDIDLDAAGISVHLLRDRVMAILESSGLVDTLIS